MYAATARTRNVIIAVHFSYLKQMSLNGQVSLCLIKPHAKKSYARTEGNIITTY
jgi:hypothetical protein